MSQGVTDGNGAAVHVGSPRRQAEDRGSSADEAGPPQTATVLRDYHVATRNLRQAQVLQREVLERLERVPMTGYRASPPETMTEIERRAWEAQQVALAGQVGLRGMAPRAPAGPAADPLPRPLTPRTDHATTRGRTNRGRGPRWLTMKIR